MSPEQPAGKYGKFGNDLADAFDEVADSPGLAPAEVLEILGIELSEGIVATLPPLDPEQLRNVASSIRAGAIPAFWPWIWFIPWINYVVPQGQTSA